MEFRYRNRNLSIEVSGDGALELYVEGCLRKRRAHGERQPQYVWTNVELEWEEHIYIEARYWSESRQLEITVNGDGLFSGTLGDTPCDAS